MQNQSELYELRLRQVDGELSKWRVATLPSPPPAGWTQTIRESLSMTAAGLRSIEASEADGCITLATLRKMAEALDCELRYALVLRELLDDKLMARSKSVVVARMGSVAHSITLEDQQVNDQQTIDNYLESAARSLIRRSSRSLW